MDKPRIGITCDIESIPNTERTRIAVRSTYANMVVRAGGIPVLLVSDDSLVDAHLASCDGFVFSGGDDPRTEGFGVTTDPRITPVHPTRQQYETALLRRLEQDHPDVPVLGVCLGMQMMALVGGGALDQHMPDSMPLEAHWGSVHAVKPTASAMPNTLQACMSCDMFPCGTVYSNHKQAVTDAGSLDVIATSDDDVVEAIGSSTRQFYLGVQWHPERTDDNALGLDLFRALILACRFAAV